MSKGLFAAAILAGSICMAQTMAPQKLWQPDAMASSVVISDFSNVSPSGALMRGEFCRDKWELVDYECTRGKGTMIYSRRGTVPEPVTVEPGLEGWYRIYVATFSGQGGRLWLRLSDDTSPSIVLQGRTGASYWNACEQGEEIFWKCADLTGRSITVGKLAGKLAAEARIGLLWLRFEAMTAEEVAQCRQEFKRPEDKRLHAHSDMDWIYLYGPDATMDDYCCIIDSYRDSDVALASVEVYTSISDMSDEHERYKGPDADLLEFRWPSQLALDKRREEVYREYARRAELYGIKLLAAHRMSLSNFLIPGDDICCSDNRIVSGNPQWWCRDRDGEPVAYLSYAYPEVGDYMIKQFLRMADMGFHGVTLLLHRGIEMLFEEPVLERFKEKYPDVEPTCLSLNDERLAGVRCELFTDFMVRLRKALDEYSESHGRPHLWINTVVGFGLADNRRLGLDVAGWMKNGLVDSVVVANMRVYENEDLFKDEAHPGLLSVEKYHDLKEHSEFSPIRRAFGNMADQEVKCIPEYMALSKETGIKCYFDIQWEGSLPPEKIGPYAKRLYDNGAENLAMWDCYELRVSNRPEWFVTSRLGHKEMLTEFPATNDAYRRLFRMLSINGVKYSGYHPNWRG